MYKQELYKGINVEADCLIHFSVNKRNHFYVTGQEKMATGSIQLSGVVQLDTPTFTCFQEAYIIFFNNDTEYEIIFGMPNSNLSIIINKKYLNNMLNIIEGKAIAPITFNEANLSEHGIFPIEIFSYIYLLKFYQGKETAGEVYITSLYNKRDYSGYIFQKKSFRQRNLIDFTCSFSATEYAYFIEIPRIKSQQKGTSMTIEISKNDMKRLRTIIS